MSCPLCKCQKIVDFDRDKHREFFLCEACTLVYVPRTSILNPADEKKRYDAHENEGDSFQYANYLGRIAKTILPFLQESSAGLDFGCGRTKLLAQLLNEKTSRVDSFDLYFYPEEEIWNQKYHFIILSEVIEHLADPIETMKRLTQLLPNDGQFFIKTKFYPSDPLDFKQWFYKRDLTHVQFFNEKSFEELAQILNLSEAEKIGEDLFRFMKRRN